MALDQSTRGLPLLDKNAYLSTFIGHNAVYSHLAYTHYDIGRQYILKDKVFLSAKDIAENIYQKSFWESYFQTLQKKFSWKIFNDLLDRGQSAESNSLRVVQEFSNEGFGVAGVKMRVGNNSIDFKNLVAGVRGFSNSVNIGTMDKKDVKSVLVNFARKYGYEDVLLVDANLLQFNFFRITKKDQILSLSDSLEDQYSKSDARIKWDNHFALIDQIRNSKLRAFLLNEISATPLQNLWANFVLNPTFTTSSEYLKDMIRSYFTIQIVSVYNDKHSLFQDFGEKKEKSLVILTGDLTELVNEKSLTVGLIDGLELRGEVDLLIDRESQFFTFGKNYTEGINSTEFIFTDKSLYEPLIKLIIPSVGKKEGDRKLLFTGNIVSNSVKTQVFALAPEISVVPLSLEHRSILEGKFIKESYLHNHGYEMEMIFNPEERAYKHVVFDARYKPIVYGPEPRVNRSKMSSWFND